jgi:hypothetical protein
VVWDRWKTYELKLKSSEVNREVNYINVLNDIVKE